MLTGKRVLNKQTEINHGNIVQDLFTNFQQLIFDNATIRLSS